MVGDDTVCVIHLLVTDTTLLATSDRYGVTRGTPYTSFARFAARAAVDSLRW